ncbi:HAD family hydrolase [Kibdelosporangium phytohabitans]|uniref:HAD family hydrolase n=1 Tax=Kibdelosporangium phytohabitans TaxID=860235 RepID=A0A0N9IBI3_9PSEU|nr:HAD family phosphatase [Kibdelosporangium phytohabitans]ALG11842.1 hypothetical protein AOZ06_37655 [Kibdelosporangium phytohabitans]MBE1463263.1 HAD superfamily hydrolase (TIGR01509 family) [Kibdelosporangium phytohabitans]
MEPERGYPTVFDLDETLADSAAAWNEAFGWIAARHGYLWTARDWAAIQGHGVARWSRYVAGRCPGLTPQRAVTACTAWMVEAVAVGRVRPLRGAVELVAAAAGHGPVGLVSAAPCRYVLAVTGAFGLAPYFAVVVTGEDATRGNSYLLAASRLGVAPERCLAVEDSGWGVRSAHAAGMTVLAIPNPRTALDADSLALATYRAADAVSAVGVLPGMAIA